MFMLKRCLYFIDTFFVLIHIFVSLLMPMPRLFNIYFGEHPCILIDARVSLNETMTITT